MTKLFEVTSWINLLKQFFDLQSYPLLISLETEFSYLPDLLIFGGLIGLVGIFINKLNRSKHPLTQANTPNAYMPLENEISVISQPIEAVYERPELPIDDHILRIMGYDKLQRHVALDVETTGLDSSQDRIVQIAIIDLTKVLDEFGSAINKDENLMETSFCAYINPMKPIPDYASRIHGITDDDVANAQPFEYYSTEILDRIGNAVIVGHNIQFDMDFLNSELERIGRPPQKNDFVCTLSLSRQRLPGTTSYRLNDLATKYKINEGISHDAMSDAITAGNLFALIIRYQCELFRNPPPPQMIKLEGGKQMSEYEWLMANNIVESLQFRPGHNYPNFSVQREGITYRVNINYDGKIDSISYQGSYGWSKMTSRNRFWNEIQQIAEVYNPTTVTRFSSEVEAHVFKQTHKKINTLPELNERFGFNGMLSGHLKVTSNGMYYFRATLDAIEYVVNFDNEKKLVNVTSSIWKNGEMKLVEMRKNNPRYELFAKMAEKYNPMTIKPKKSSSQ